MLSVETLQGCSSCCCHPGPCVALLCQSICSVASSCQPACCVPVNCRTVVCVAMSYHSCSCCQSTCCTPTSFKPVQCVLCASSPPGAASPPASPCSADSFPVGPLPATDLSSLVSQTQDLLLWSHPQVLGRTILLDNTVMVLSS
jgi:hypothetical protein